MVTSGLFRSLGNDVREAFELGGPGLQRLVGLGEAPLLAPGLGRASHHVSDEEVDRHRRDGQDDRNVKDVGPAGWTRALLGHEDGDRRDTRDGDGHEETAIQHERGGEDRHGVEDGRRVVDTLPDGAQEVDHGHHEGQEDHRGELEPAPPSQPRGDRGEHGADKQNDRARHVARRQVGDGPEQRADHDRRLKDRQVTAHALTLRGRHVARVR